MIGLINSGGLIRIIFIIATISIVFTLIKKSIKLAILVAIVLLFFRIVFIFDGNDMKETFNLKEDNKIVSFWDDFSRKRNDYAIIDTNKTYDAMVDGVENATEYATNLAIDKQNKYFNKQGNISKTNNTYNEQKTLDKNNVIDNDRISYALAKSIIENDLEDRVTHQDLNKVLKKTMSELTENDRMDIVIKTIDILQSK